MFSHKRPSDHPGKHDEDGILQPSHNCLDYLSYRECCSTEPHGETHRDEWWECAYCGNKFTERDVEHMANSEPVRKDVASQASDDSITEVA